MDNARIITSMDWMIEHFKWANAQTGLGDDYSPELREAIEVLEILKKEIE